MRHSRTSALAAFFLAAGLGACSTGRQLSRDTLLTEAPPRQLDRVCRVASYPEQLPTAVELVDAGFAAEAARLWEASGRPAGYVLLSMRYDRTGLNVRRSVIEHSVDAELADQVQELVFAHRLQTPPSRGEWGVRLRVDLGQEPALRVGRREECRPAPREPAYSRSATGFDVRELRASSVSAPSLSDLDLVWVHVRVNASGIVTDARVERSLYRGIMESRVLNAVRGIQFHPALDDGFPVASETSIPLRLSSLR